MRPKAYQEASKAVFAIFHDLTPNVEGISVDEAFLGTAGVRADGAVLDEEGFFDTGDVSTIDPDGYMRITDRAKDIVKSTGRAVSTGTKKLGSLAGKIGDEVRKRARNVDRPTPPRAKRDK